MDCRLSREAKDPQTSVCRLRSCPESASDISMTLSKAAAFPPHLNFIRELRTIFHEENSLLGVQASFGRDALGMLREASTPSDGEGWATRQDLPCGLTQGPGVGTAHRADLVIMAGLQVPDVLFTSCSVDCLRTHKGVCTLIPESSD